MKRKITVVPLFFFALLLGLTIYPHLVLASNCNPNYTSCHPPYNRTCVSLVPIEGECINPVPDGTCIALPGDPIYTTSCASMAGDYGIPVDAIAGTFTYVHNICTGAMVYLYDNCTVPVAVPSTPIVELHFSFLDKAKSMLSDPAHLFDAVAKS